MSDLSYHKIRKARKPHECYLCYTTIKPGDFYQYEAFTWDGRIGHNRSCLPCVGVTREVWDCYSPDNGVGPDEADEWAYEFFFSNATARDYLRRKWSDLPEAELLDVLDPGTRSRKTVLEADPTLRGWDRIRHHLVCR